MSEEIQDSAAEAEAWVKTNRPVVEEAYKQFLSTGEWPEVTAFQRLFDRRYMDVNVREIADSRPRILNEMRMVHTERIILHLRHLMWVPSAEPLVGMAMGAVRRAVAAYLSDAERPEITSTDPLIIRPTPPSRRLGTRLFTVLRDEHPSPFGGYNKTARNPNDESEIPDWTIVIDSRFVRTFRNVTNINEFIHQQDRIRAQAVAEVRHAASSWNPVSPFHPENVFGVTVEEQPVTNEAPLLFLSWSRTRSRKVAACLEPIFARRFVGVEVFFSPTSIEPGTDPSQRLFEDSLLRANAMVVVLTDESAQSAYVIWEAGAAWGRQTLVVPVFVNIVPTNVFGPLHTKVQGVHLSDRSDLDRALTRLAREFGFEGVDPLTDDEHGDLLRAALSVD